MSSSFSLNHTSLGNNPFSPNSKAFSRKSNLALGASESQSSKDDSYINIDLGKIFQPLMSILSVNAKQDNSNYNDPQLNEHISASLRLLA